MSKFKKCVNLADKEGVRGLLKGIFEEKESAWVENLVETKNVKGMGQIQMKDGQGSTISVDLGRRGG